MRSLRYAAVLAAFPALAALAVSAGLPGPAHAQSITTGAVSGHVFATTGEGLGSVRLELRPLGGGLSLVTRSGPAGQFTFPLVEPGRYELLAERLGYRPVILSPLPVRVDDELGATVTLSPAQDVVRSSEPVDYDGRALALSSRPGRVHVFPEWERETPHRRAELGELLRLTTSSTEESQVEGLPLALGALTAEGLLFQPAVNPAAGDRLGTMLYPNRAMEAAALLAGRPDAEWAGSAGGLLSAQLPGGTGRAGGELGGVYTEEALVTDDITPRTLQSWRAGGSGGAYLVADSAHIWVFGEGSYFDLPVRYFNSQAGDPAAFEAVGLNIGDAAEYGAGTTRQTNAGGTFDWWFGGQSRVDVTVLYGQGEQEHAVAPFSGVDVPVLIEGQDLQTTASATSMVTEQVGLQFRVGYGQSSREYDSRGRAGALAPATVAFAPGNAQLGGDPSYPATIERSTFSGHGAVHVWGGDHHVKLGAGFQLTSHDRTHVTASDGLYLFDSPASFAARTGIFRGIDGTRPSATFSVPEIYAFGQDTWTIGPGLRFTTGLRYEVELLPDDEVGRSQRWLELTGIDNTDIPANAGDLTLVAGFDWDVREQHRWRVRGDVAVQIGDVAPELLGEAITYDGRVRATGAVGDVTSPIVLGSRLTILSPDMAPPMTTRASLGLSRALGGDAALHLSGVIRQTDNLPTRRDLNLPVSAPFQDQYGRPVYGRLQQVGQLLYPEPGSNRRFGEFDAVSAIASSASSTYLGVSVALEKQLGSLRAAASYTYSQTRDDWLATPDKLPLDGLSPFPGDEGVNDWADGTSDFDVPHRLVVMSELTLPFADMVTVGTFWRMESGRPFTPGFGRAIDANGDGVAGNDPAFIDTDIPGVNELADSWDCLRTSAGQFAERNSCRFESRTLLDAWIGVKVPGLGPVTPELRIEALGLDGEGFDRYDTALFQLDPEGTVTTDPGTGEVTVPLRVNPYFGEATTPGRELTRFRISMRMVF